MLTIGILIVLIVPHTLQEGMFMDSVQYSSVAKNMSEGIGDFWFPKFTESWNKAGLSTFHEQPPLGFGIQAIAYKIFGTSFYVERIYSLIIALLSSLLIWRIWKLFNQTDNALSKMGWLPILIWTTTPLVFWAYHNNILENTLGIFSLAAVFYTIKGLLNQQNKWLHFILAGVFIFCATLTKGVPGLFPLAIYGIYWVIYRNISLSKVILYTTITLLTTSLMYVLILGLSSDAYESLSFYFNERLLNRISNEPTVSNRFWIIYRLFIDLAPILFICLFLLLINIFKTKININFKPILFFLLIGFAGSLPLIMTPVQRGFYFVPSLPYFALGFSFVISAFLSRWIAKINESSFSFKAFKISSILLVLSVSTYSFLQIGKANQDRNILHDVKLIGQEIPKYSIVQTDDYILYEDWILQAYLMRYFNISLSNKKQENCYFISRIDKFSNPDLASYPLNFKSFGLYKISQCK